MAMYFSGKIGQKVEVVELPFMWKQRECIKVCIAADEEPVENLRVRIKGQANMGDTVEGVHYKPLDQEEVVDESF